MGMVVMSKRELNRLDVLARLDSDRLTAQAAAELMKITPRQTYRLLRRYRDGGASAVANQRRGRPSNNRLRCERCSPPCDLALVAPFWRHSRTKRTVSLGRSR